MLLPLAMPIKKDVPNNQAHPHEKGLYLGDREISNGLLS
ncbi:hypothetical protein SAMN04487901_1073 [Prevotella communis]|uniref:Uncharacterized protein n=1 Tax=Prevotella communis TaxID=2913614 RepID=A0A1G7VZZ7_9BACT|nr:hypothetical protein SAMN04487901_1073 [Prevotella communis]